MWRRAGLCVLLLGLASSSAFVTTMIASRGWPRPGSVAVSQDAPALLPAPVSEVTTPVPSQAPAPPQPAPTAPAEPASAGRCVTVPILYYHYIRINPNPRDRLGYQLSVAPSRFQAQMDWLRASGAHPVTLEAVMAAMGGGTSLPSRPVVLTFDDGHDDFATAAVPVLMREHFVATSFVVPGFLGTPSYMTQAQVRQVAAEGMVIGAHTMHHVSLKSVSSQVAAAEIGMSKSVLEQMIGRPVFDFAYPYGTYTPAVVSQVAQAGFRDAVATSWGQVQCPGNRLVLHRLEIVGAYTLSDFAFAAGVPPPPPGWRDPGPPAPSPSTAASPSVSPSPSSPASPSSQASSAEAQPGPYDRKR